jgi:hypothetical protein
MAGSTAPGLAASGVDDRRGEIMKRRILVVEDNVPNLERS